CEQNPGKRWRELALSDQPAQLDPRSIDRGATGAECQGAVRLAAVPINEVAVIALFVAFPNSVTAGLVAVVHEDVGTLVRVRAYEIAVRAYERDEPTVGGHRRSTAEPGVGGSARFRAVGGDADPRRRTERSIANEDVVAPVRIGRDEVVSAAREGDEAPVRRHARRQVVTGARRPVGRDAHPRRQPRPSI